MEGAELRVEVEVMRRTRDDVERRLGVVEAQMRSLTSTLGANFAAQQGVGPAGVQSQGSRRSGSRRLLALVRGMPRGLFRGKGRCEAQVDMCH